MLRFKYLADMLKKRKEAEARQEEGNEAAGEVAESATRPDTDTDTSTVSGAAPERCLTTADS